MASDDKGLAVLTHILGILTGFLGPLIVMLLTKSESVKQHARNALNWQISLLIYSAISVVLVLILIGIPLLIGLSILNIVFSIIAAVKASNNEAWKYPLSIRFLKT